MGLGACGGGMGDDCGDGLAILCSNGSSLLKDHYLKVMTKYKYKNFLTTTYIQET